MKVETLTKKVARLRRGGKARVLDLFAGCGGLSLGFQAAAGFMQEAALEFDPDAARSHGLNFHGGDPKHCQASISAICSSTMPPAA
jgi:DNA (cytosine-5)-methyltransferase 1